MTEHTSPFSSAGEAGGSTGPDSATAGTTPLEERSATPSRPFVERLVAALRLDATLYEEVEHDADALPQAAGVVALAAVAAAVGALGMVGVGGVLGALVNTFVTWIVWTTLVWLIGVKVFDHASDFEELLRTLGFVTAPQILYVLAILPFAVWHTIVGAVVLVMSVIAFVRALRQALDVDTGRAVLVAGIAVVAQVLLVAGLAAMAGAG